MEHNQAWGVIQILKEYEKNHPDDPLYEGEYPDYDDKPKVIDLAKQYLGFAEAMHNDGSKDPLVHHIISAATGNAFIAQNEPEQYEEQYSNLQDTVDRPKIAKLEDLSDEDREKVEQVLEHRNEPEVREKINDPVVNELKPFEEEESWLSGLNRATEEWNIPIPEALNEEDIPTIPRDLTKISVEKQHALTGKVNAVLGISIWQCGQARTDIKQITFLKKRKYADLFREYVAEGKSKTAAKEDIEHEESYVALEERLAKASATRDHWQTYVDIFSNHKDLLSRSIEYRKLEYGK